MVWMVFDSAMTGSQRPETAWKLLRSYYLSLREFSFLSELVNYVNMLFRSVYLADIFSETKDDIGFAKKSYLALLQILGEITC